MNLKKIVATIILLLTINAAGAQDFIIGSFNIRYDNKRDSGNLWVDRAPVVSNLIRFHNFDVFGTQEGLKNQLDDISNALQGYSRQGVGRNDGIDKGEHSAIYYKTEKFTLLNKGNFWLSQTPDKPSLGWDATCCHRICSWVYLQAKSSGKKFYFFNAHFDHQGVQARKESSLLIVQKIKAIAGKEPVIFTGDLNGSHTSDWYNTVANSTILTDAFKQVKYPYVNNASFNAFGATKGRYDIIDHVFVSDHFTVSKWGLLTDTYHGKFPSDHFPVLTVVSLK